MIHVLLDIPDPLRSPARSVLRAFALQWGVRTVVSEQLDESAAGAGYDLVYTSRPEAWTHRCVIPCDPRVYDPNTPCGLARTTRGEGWAPDGTRFQDIDWVGGAYRLLALLDETLVPTTLRDRYGSFFHYNLPADLRRDPTRALVQEHADALWRELLASRPELEREAVPHWPDGAKFSLIVSSDVDAVHLGHPLELLTNMAKAIRRFDPMRLRMVVDGLKHAGNLSGNPFNQFEAWRSFGDAIGFRGIFYLFHRPRGVCPGLNDCKSTIAGSPELWPTLRDMAEEGWEFGLHPSLHAKDKPGAFDAGRRWLEDVVEAPVRGVRHHYLALDWHHPTATLRQHAAAGFAHDSSLGWRDTAGFRAGSALPYRPLDPDTGSELPLVELPMTIMDGQVLNNHHAEASARATVRAVIEQVRRHKGILVLNWHQETASDAYCYRGYHDFFTGLLSDLLPGAWVATPQQVVEHWQSREQALTG